MDQTIARIHRVLEVQCDIALALHRNRNTALRIVRVRLGHRLFGDNKDLAMFGELNRCTQPRNPGAHHQKIDTGHQRHNF